MTRYDSFRFRFLDLGFLWDFIAAVSSFYRHRQRLADKMPEKDDKAVLIIGEEEYRLNQLRIDEARRYIDNWDAMNEQAKKEYDQMQADLQRKIREGEEARCVFITRYTTHY